MKEFAIKTLKQYAKENQLIVRGTSDLSPLEEWLISKQYEMNKLITPIYAERYDKDKYTPPFRVGKKQGKAVLDSKGLEVIFFRDSENQAKAYCDYLNNIKPIN